MKKRLGVILALALTIVAAAALFISGVYAATPRAVRGDVDGNGMVDTNDLILLRKYFANYDYDNGIAPFEILEGADANKDGVINTVDLISIRSYISNGFWNAKNEIVENGDTASVVTKQDLNYTVSGYKSIEDDMFVFDTGLEIVFEDGSFADEFNRLNFEYSSSDPIKVFITYTLEGEEKTDYFFLEATKNSFRGLIEGYLADKKGVELKKLTIDTCEKTEGRFILENLKTEVIPLYDDDLTVENDRYKIGCRLSWGGAMTYFEDKMDGDEELGNLVNIHDTGRLIQQSFYGTYTNNEGYTSVPNGGEGATLWPYNPVQGGDRKNNGSDRLIDVEYDEEKDYIYIVTQPLDWAYVKGTEYEGEYQGLTYTYYENTYSIMKGESDSPDDDYVVVDNVMTDFTGWEHVAGGQEIPAVYLVSYFDTLSYYNGIKPWTNDDTGICYEENLAGWSNAGNFPLYKGNTETWSIWINSDDNFGFGTYCPNIQKHIAIRHQYDGSKDPMANSTSYVAPSCSIVMQSYKPITYSYILATGDPEEIRDIFNEHKDFTDNASLSEDRYDQLVTYGKFDMMNMDFTDENNKDIFFAVRHMDLEYDENENALKMYVVNGNDPHASMSFDLNSDKVINSDDFNTIEIEYMLPMSNSKSGDTLVLFISAGEFSDYKETNTVKGTIVRDGEYHTLKIRVPKTKFQGDLHKIRFDTFTSAAAGDIMYIKNISFTTLEYPELGVDNDMSIPRSDNLPSEKRYTETYMDETENALALKVSGGGDVSITLDFTQLYLSTLEYTGLQIEYMIPTTNSTTHCYSSIYFATSKNNSINGDKTVSSGKLTVDGEYHTMTFDFTQKADFWTGDITNLRFDFFQNTPKDGDVMYIKRITFIRIPEYEIDISGDETGEHFDSTNHTDVSFDEAENAVKLVANGVANASGQIDVYVVKDISGESLNTADYTKLFIRYMIPTTNSKGSYSAAVYFTTDSSSGYSEDKAIYRGLTVDGQYHTVVFDLSAKSTWTGDISNIRFDFFQGPCSNGDVIYIESINLG